MTAAVQVVARGEGWDFIDVGGHIYRVHSGWESLGPDTRGIPMGVRYEGQRDWWDRAYPHSYTWANPVSESYALDDMIAWGNNRGKAMTISNRKGLKMTNAVSDFDAGLALWQAVGSSGSSAYSTFPSPFAATDAAIRKFVTDLVGVKKAQQIVDQLGDWGAVSKVVRDLLTANAPQTKWASEWMSRRTGRKVTNAADYTLWGKPKGSSDGLDEAILGTGLKSPSDVERVKAAAAKDGWHSFRVQKMDMDDPEEFDSFVKMWKGENSRRGRKVMSSIDRYENPVHDQRYRSAEAYADELEREGFGLEADILRSVVYRAPIHGFPSMTKIKGVIHRAMSYQSLPDYQSLLRKWLESLLLKAQNSRRGRKVSNGSLFRMVESHEEWTRLMTTDSRSTQSGWYRDVDMTERATASEVQDAFDASDDIYTDWGWNIEPKKYPALVHIDFARSRSRGLKAWAFSSRKDRHSYDASVVDTIIEQVGGNRLKAMTGASFIADGSSLNIMFPKNPGKVRYIKVTYNRERDDYSVTIYGKAGMETLNGVYADMLKEIIRDRTGFDLHLSRKGRKVVNGLSHDAQAIYDAIQYDEILGDAIYGRGDNAPSFTRFRDAIAESVSRGVVGEDEAYDMDLLTEVYREVKKDLMSRHGRRKINMGSGLWERAFIQALSVILKRDSAFEQAFTSALGRGATGDKMREFMRDYIAKGGMAGFLLGGIDVDSLDWDAIVSTIANLGKIRNGTGSDRDRSLKLTYQRVDHKILNRYDGEYGSGVDGERGRKMSNGESDQVVAEWDSGSSVYKVEEKGWQSTDSSGFEWIDASGRPVTTDEFNRTTIALRGGPMDGSVLV